MRIISQRHNLSVDFDHTTISVSYNHMLANVYGEDKVLGIYKTDARANEVFEDIHKAYSGMPIVLNNVEITDDVKDFLQNSCINAIMTRTADKSSIEYINNGIYTMPAE